MAVYTQLTISELRKILALYAIQLVNFRPIEGGNSNSNYYIQAKEGAYMLTIAETQNLTQVLIIAKLLRWLNKHQFFTTKVVPTIDGVLVTQFGEKPIFVKEWIEGKVLERFSELQLMQIGKEMARLHQIPPPNDLPKISPFGYQMFDTAIGKGIDVAFEDWLEERQQFLIQYLPHHLPQGLIHGDVFFDNVLFEDGELKAIIDFEEACHYYFVFGIAMGILGTCRTGEVIHLYQAKALVQGYETLRSLSFSEKAALQLFVEYTAIALAWWRYWKYNIQSPWPERKDKYLEMVRIAKAVRAVDKEVFLEGMFG